MSKELLKEAIIKYLSGVILMGALLFIPAGSFSWTNGWLLMGLLFIPMLIAGIIMYLKAPDLLRSRLNAKETQDQQKNVIRLSGFLFLASFVLAGLNYRFQWHHLPAGVVPCACVVFLLAYLMFGEVLRENAFLSRTIEVRENQTVVDSGLYGIVRHPMYTATIFLFLSMPLILNSLISFLIMLFYIPVIIMRIRNEESILEKELSGYTEYKKKVKYRLLPFVW
ncbi:MAG: isoprenylcysteine carboxylmethyltransferase family protein [Anaerolineaceae bacterium]|nr:isoprenylcysteine carboxylmethyltransferase family protein [Anaerolineaceae bacterium]